MGLSNICNIAHVKTINSNNFFFFRKTTIIYSKVLYLILNMQVSIQNILNFLTYTNLHMIKKKTLSY